MKKFAIVAALLILIGCGKQYVPINRSPSELDLIGSWELINFPSGEDGFSPVRVSRESAITFLSGGEVVLSNFTDKRGVPLLMATPSGGLKGAWRIGEWHRENSVSNWRVYISVDNYSLMLILGKLKNDELVLIYRPDPEMSEPYLFQRKKG